LDILHPVGPIEETLIIQLIILQQSRLPR
jgi:hypothetical protein